MYRLTSEHRSLNNNVRDYGVSDIAERTLSGLPA
jgi:hypothetical protein